MIGNGFNPFSVLQFTQRSMPGTFQRAAWPQQVSLACISREFVKGSERVYHVGGGIVYHPHDEKELNWEPGGVGSGQEQGPSVDQGGRVNPASGPPVPRWTRPGPTPTPFQPHAGRRGYDDPAATQPWAAPSGHVQAAHCSFVTQSPFP